MPSKIDGERAPEILREEYLPSFNKGYKSKQVLNNWIAQESFSDVPIEQPIELSSDLWEYCFQFLSIDDILQCEQVSYEWNMVTNQTYLWYRVYRYLWHSKSLLANLPQLEWRNIVQQRYQQQYYLSSRAKSWTRRNGIIMVHNDSVLRSFLSGSVESIRTEEALQPMELSVQLNHPICYFEATVRGGASVGIVSISTADHRSEYGWSSQNHVGWAGVSYGYHSDDGNLFWNDGSTSFGGVHEAYSQPWGVNGSLTTKHSKAVTVGCGYDMYTHRLFFTVNGIFQGEFSRDIREETYAAAVSLHQLGDMVELNFGNSEFQFDIEAYCIEK